MFSRVGEIHNSSFNYQSTAADKISAARSVNADNNNESYYKALSDKDSRFDQDMVKYAFEYDANKLFEDQQDRLKKENIKNSFSTFARS